MHSHSRISPSHCTCHHYARASAWKTRPAEVDIAWPTRSGGSPTSDAGPSGSSREPHFVMSGRSGFPPKWQLIGHPEAHQRLQNAPFASARSTSPRVLRVGFHKTVRGVRPDGTILWNAGPTTIPYAVAHGRHVGQGIA